MDKMDIIGYIRPLKRSGEIGSKTPCSNNCIIGRESCCYIKIPSNDVDKKHCLITSNAHGQCYLSNLTLKYPTLLNGVVLGYYKTELRHGDMITIADRHLLWEYVEESQLYNEKSDYICKPSEDISKTQRHGRLFTNRSRNITSPMTMGTHMKLSSTKFNPENDINPGGSIDLPKSKAPNLTSTRHFEYPYAKRNFSSHITASSEVRKKAEKISVTNTVVKRKVETDSFLAERANKKIKLSNSPKATNKKKMCHDKLSRKRILKRRGIKNKKWSTIINETSQNVLRIELGHRDVWTVYDGNAHMEHPRQNSFNVSQLRGVHIESLLKNTTTLKSVNLTQTSDVTLENILAPGTFVKLTATPVVARNRYVNQPTSKFALNKTEVQPVSSFVVNRKLPSLPTTTENKRLKSIKGSTIGSTLKSTDKVEKRRLKYDIDEKAVKKVKISNSPKVQKVEKKKNNGSVLRHDKAVRKQLKDRRGWRALKMRCV